MPAGLTTLRGHFRKRRYRSQTVWSASFQSPKDAAVRDSLAIMALGLQIHAPQQVGEARARALGIDSYKIDPYKGMAKTGCQVM
jgi:hypothetical protein